ncbi:MAG: hypothetical protein V3W31_02315 [Thermodesulfobacteriota bacterium]
MRWFLPVCFIFVLFCAPRASATELHGFLEGAYGAKFADKRGERDRYNLMEARLQLKGLYFPALLEDHDGELFFKAEFLADGYDDDLYFYFRELNLFLSPAESVDMKLGRQVLTWGTGDFLFVNDLFPKDYVAFFTGRADEYLKRPSDAARLWFFTDAASFDFVLIPVFEPNESLRGERVSFYDGIDGEIVGEGSVRSFEEPPRTAENAELAARAYRTFGSVEGAVYFFRGFYKEPRGVLDASKKEFFYPRLNVYGMSLRGPVWGGIGSVELGYYESRDDRGGGDGSVENSSVKYLFGYTRDMGGELKVGLQWLVEEMLDYGEYRRSLPPEARSRDEFRQLLTLRITKLLRSQTLTLSLFTFYSPTDDDVYLRPSVSYAVSDNLKVTAGANLFSGADDHTEFGQLEGNQNAYVRVRYGF